MSPVFCNGSPACADVKRMKTVEYYAASSTVVNPPEDGWVTQPELMRCLAFRNNVPKWYVRFGKWETRFESNLVDDHKK